MRVKNNSGATKTWCGQELTSNQEYDLQPTDIIKFQSSNDVMTDLASGDLLIGDATAYKVSGAEAISFLLGVNTSPVDSDGAALSRAKVTQTGWQYQLMGFEIQTSTTDGVYGYNAAGDNLTSLTYKMYNANGDLTTTPAECVKTVVDYEPTYDYEIVGGGFWQKNAPTSDMYYSVMAVPDIPAAYGGSKVFVQALDITYIGASTELKADGRAPKRMYYSSTNHTNKLRIIVEHEAGAVHKFLQTIEHFIP